MGEMKVSIINGKIINEWVGSFGEFKGNLKPAMPPFSGLDQPEALTKWLIMQFWVGLIAHTVNFVLNFLNGFMLIGPLISGILGAFIVSWVSWFMLVKREPSCCCFCIIIIENWNLQHLVYGVLMLLYGIQWSLQALNAVQAAMLLPGGVSSMGFIYSVISFAIMVLYSITFLFIGISAVKIGGKKAGVELPAA